MSKDNEKIIRHESYSTIHLRNGVFLASAIAFPEDSSERGRVMDLGKIEVGHDRLDNPKEKALPEDNQ